MDSGYNETESRSATENNSLGVIIYKMGGEEVV